MGGGFTYGTRVATKSVLTDTHCFDAHSVEYRTITDNFAVWDSRHPYHAFYGGQHCASGHPWIESLDQWHYGWIEESPAVNVTRRADNSLPAQNAKRASAYASRPRYFVSLE